MLTSPALAIAFGLFFVVFGIIFVLKSASIADIMWTRNESLTRYSRLLAMPRGYYLWLCRVGGTVMSIVGVGLVGAAVVHLLA